TAPPEPVARPWCVVSTTSGRVTWSRLSTEVSAPGVAPGGIGGASVGSPVEGEVLMDVEDARTIGQRLREIRYWRGKSLRVVAELAGISGPGVGPPRLLVFPVPPKQLGRLTTTFRVVDRTAKDVQHTAINMLTLIDHQLFVQNLWIFALKISNRSDSEAH
ncbi:MAG: hypothetical protein WAK86_04270, partial [Pseudonocardiaceae bacterium]